ncbi:Anoctamin-7 [Entophlyctis luteolus]|nr:Anoctamin-7 [Entophlyctis luteolus]
MAGEDIHVRTKGRRSVFLHKPGDVALFDRTQSLPTSSSQDSIINLHFGFKRVDYVLKFTQSKGDHIRRRFEIKLVKKGLIVEREISVEDPKDIYVKITAPFCLLCVEAQMMKLKLPLQLDKDYERRVSIASQSNRTSIFSILNRFLATEVLDMNSQTATFKRKDLSRFRGGNTNNTDLVSIQVGFFRDSHRSLLVSDTCCGEKKLIVTIEKTLNVISKVELTIQVSARQRERKGIDYLLSEGIYTSMFHLHDDMSDDTTTRSYLYNEWVRKYFAHQPIDEVASYFGETVGFYFAFAGFYTMWLIIPSVLGVIVVLYGFGQARSTPDGSFNWFLMFDNNLTPPFGLLTSLWAILMPVVWNQRTKVFSWKWATNEFQKEETRRPQYKGEAKSPITGKQELYFPKTKRLGRQTMSALFILFWILLVFLSIAVQVSIGAYLSPRINNDIAINALTSLLGLVSIIFMKIPFRSVVDRLNEWENYRTKSQFDNALIFKTYLFDFANSYAQLIYYAFVKPNLLNKNLFGFTELDDSCTKSECASSVTINLFIIFIGGQVIERFQELAIPLIVSKFNLMIAAVRFKSRIRRMKVADSHKAESPDTGPKDVPVISVSETVTEKEKQVVISFDDQSRSQGTLPAYFSKTQGLRSSYKNESKSIISTQSASPAESVISENSSADSMPTTLAAHSVVREQQLDSERDLIFSHAELPQHYKDDKLHPFGGIRDEYAQKIIQFGYVALFACSFPLAPLFALLNNVYELRADAFKMLVVSQRPEPFLAQDIGVWEDIIKVVAGISVATNSLIVSLTSPTFDQLFISNLDPSQQMAVRLAFIIVFHYVVFALTQIIRVLLPTTPVAIATAMARAQYLERVRMDQDLEEEDENVNAESLWTLSDSPV